MIKPYFYTDNNGNRTEYKSVDYNAMLFMFINAFKEQQKLIDEYSSQNKMQQQQIDELRSEIEAIKKMKSE